jgi:hypothetical protein
MEREGALKVPARAAVRLVNAAWTASKIAAVKLRRFLELDRLAARFNRWFGPAAMAVEAGPGDARMQHDPNAIVGVLGEIERQGGAPTEGEGDEDLPPLELDRANFDELRRHGD